MPRLRKVRSVRAHHRIIAVLTAILAVLTLGSSAEAAPALSVQHQRDTLFAGSTFNFGETRQDRSLTRTFTITNFGDTDLTISAATVALPFQITQPPDPVVAPGRRIVVRVTLVEGLPPGDKQADLTIRSNDALRPEFVIRLNAVVTPVAPVATVFSGPTPVLHTTSLNVGSTMVGVPLRRALAIANTGNANLTISGITAVGPFTIAGRTTATLRPGKRLRITLVFDPASAGNAAGELRIASNAPATPTYRVALSAVGTPADAVLAVFSEGEPVLSGGTLFFATTRSDRRIDRLFTIRNEGRSPLTLSNVAVTGAGFSLLSMPRSPLGPGKSTKFKVRFDPAGAPAEPTGRLAFTSNSPGREQFSVNFEVEVIPVAPAIVLQSGAAIIDAGATFDFGETNLNIVRERTFTITNAGSADLLLGDVSVTGTGYSVVRQPAERVRPGRSTTFTVRLFSATEITSATGTVSFATNVAAHPTFSFTLSGAVRVPVPAPKVDVRALVLNPQGVLVEVAVAPGTTQSLGPITSSQSLSRQYRVRNTGTANLTLGPVNITGDPVFGPAMQALPMTLAPGAPPATFTVNFTPSAPGMFTGQVSFTNNDPNRNPFTFTLRGTAIAPNQFISVRYGGTEVMRCPTLPTCPAPLPIGAVPAGTSTVHNTPQDSILITNLGDDALFVTDVSAFPNILDAWLVHSIVPEPTFPPTPIPQGGQVRVNLEHIGLAPGSSVVTIRIVNNFTNLSPFFFRLVEWVMDWFPTSGGLSGGAVRALHNLDFAGSGPTGPTIFAGGAFTTPTSRIARLNGGTWEALTGGGINNGEVRALSTFDEDGSGPNPPRLFAAGTFTSAGTPALSASSIAKWNGTNWDVLGTEAVNGVSGGPINAMAVFDPDGSAGTAFNPELYVAGGFLNVANIAGSTIALARWNGTRWARIHDTVPTIAGGVVNALAVYDDDGPSGNPARLVAAGTFTTAGNATANKIARWTGSAWFSVDPGFLGAADRVNALTVFDPDGPGTQNPVLVIAGSFQHVGNPSQVPPPPGTLPDVNNIVQWNGVSWQRLAGGLSPGEVFALATIDEDGFFPADNQNTDISKPARLYAAGNFMVTLPNGDVARNIARWDGVQWTAVGAGMANGTDGPVFALRAFDPTGPNNDIPGRLFVGGLFTQVQQVALEPDVPVMVDNIAVWGSSAP